MTPVAIREAIQQTHYLVVCDCCHGKMFVEGVICGKCNGDGRVLIFDEPITHVSKKTARSALFAIVFVCLLVAAVILSLK
jgi:hypothetical protein